MKSFLSPLIWWDWMPCANCWLIRRCTEPMSVDAVIAFAKPSLAELVDEIAKTVMAWSC